MPVKACKFGGSSLADANQIRKVREIVQSDPERRYVVPSAPGKRSLSDQKITDLLYLCHEHARQGLPFDDVFALIGQRYREIVRDLSVPLDINSHLEEVKQFIKEGAERGDGPDYAASRGEYLNGLIVADTLQYEFVDAAEVIFFSPNGRLDEERTYAALAERFKTVERGVIPGFYGSLPDGRVKTFSRGGSDISGAIVARGASASVYENWTDVSGLLMADPRVVNSPKTIDRITYRELRELSYAGASVLHDEAVFPVRAAGIPVHVRNTNEPEATGTFIMQRTDDTPVERGAITGIAGRKDFTIITVEKAMMNAELGFGRRVLNVLEVNGISFEHMPSGIDTLSLVVSDDALENKLDKVLNQIKGECEPDAIDVDPDLALIATVGRGMARTPGMAAKVFGALADAGVNIRMIDQGSSELNIIVGVNIDDYEKAMQAIYDAFVS